MFYIEIAQNLKIFLNIFIYLLSFKFYNLFENVINSL